MQAGQLTLSASSSVRGKMANEISSAEVLTFKDEDGCKQSLYFMNDDRASRQMQLYELPPLPPEGAFDVRFASGRLLEKIDRKNLNVLPIHVTSPHGLLTIRWNITPGKSHYSLLVDSKNIQLHGLDSVVLKQMPKKIELTTRAMAEVPRKFSLLQNYPNPFNPSTIIEFDLPKDALVTLKIIDLLGREVTTLKDKEPYTAGIHHAEFTATNYTSGVYFYRIMAQIDGKTFTDVKKMILLR